MSTYSTMPDLDVQLLDAHELGLWQGSHLAGLIDTLQWRAESITMFGRTIMQPRLIAFYADEGVSYTYSRRTFKGLTWTPLLEHLGNIAQQVAAAPFNSVLANYYRDGADSMGMHADDEPELGPEPVIVSMSFGATRRFVLKHRTRTDVPPLVMPLADSSIMIMRGPTQHHWLHGIKKETRPVGPRVNLTFRNVLASAPPQR
ncbi:MAG: alpha-ketoglutarate-dependent dioxygenase AlkB [Candidatus Kapabacteria bacterium]|nr:alpha-ketoglutarate-dependent dioxygenase AlkB [Candidatus Kapabacteria bacterium]